MTPDNNIARPQSPSISCYIRTLNEQRRIEEVVRAAFNIANEVVVVDSGSTDDTKALAEAAGARVFDQPWLGNGGQKRAAEDLCVNDWLLDLDADEVVTPELAENIRALFSKGEPERSVYQLRLVTVTPYGEIWETFAYAWRAKLYDRRRHRMPDHKAWDQLQLGSKVKIGRVDGALLHYSFANVEHIIAKLNKASSTRARESRLKPIWAVVPRVILAPPLYFLRHYLLRGLWKGGLYGFSIAGTAAIGRWLRDVKMLEKHYDLRRAEHHQPPSASE